MIKSIFGSAKLLILHSMLFLGRACAAMIIFIGIGGVWAEVDNLPARPKVEVRSVGIRPSHKDQSYTGVFSFIHQGELPLKIDCAERPMGRRFLPNNVQYQVLRNGIWTKVESHGEGWCFDFDIPAGVRCELDVDLSPFKEQDTPLTCRVIFNWDQYPSESFVLDWKSDKMAGKFEAAKKAHADKLRAAFLKSGFRPELLREDEFPLDILKKMIVDFKKSSKIGAWFEFPDGVLEIEPEILWKGDVYIKFDTSSVRSEGAAVAKCWGYIRWNPDKLNRALIQKLRKSANFAGVTVDEEERRPDGFSIKIEPDDDPLDPDTNEYMSRPFAMYLRFSLPKDAVFTMPKKEDTEKAIDSVMDFLSGCLVK